MRIICGFTITRFKIPNFQSPITMKIRVAGAQICVTNNIQVNQKTVLRAIDFAAAAHADILLTPEGSLSGYTPHFDQTELDEALRAVTDYARSAGVGLALGTCYVEPADGLCYDQLRFYAPDGTYLGFHTKILTCGTLTDPSEGEINDYAQAPLHTFQFEGLTVGGLVCNDMWANPGCTPVPDPHLAQMLSRMGARVDLPLGERRARRQRAIEGGVVVSRVEPAYARDGRQALDRDGGQRGAGEPACFCAGRRHHAARRVGRTQRRAGREFLRLHH